MKNKILNRVLSGILIMVMILSTASPAVHASDGYSDGIEELSDEAESEEVDEQENIAEETTDTTSERATLLSGSELNEKLKKLVGHDLSSLAEKDGLEDDKDLYHALVDEKIVSIRMADEMPDENEKTETVVISAGDSEAIYAWAEERFDSERNRYTDTYDIYYYTDAKDIYYSSDASCAFMNLSALEDLSGLSEIKLDETTNISQMFLGDAAITDFSALDSYNADLVTDYEDVFASVNTDAKLPSWYSRFVPSEKNEEQNNQTDTNETKKEDSTAVTEEKSEVADGDQKDTNTDENQVTDKSTEAEPTQEVYQSSMPTSESINSPIVEDEDAIIKSLNQIFTELDIPQKLEDGTIVKENSEPEVINEDEEGFKAAASYSIGQYYGRVTHFDNRYSAAPLLCGYFQVNYKDGAYCCMHENNPPAVGSSLYVTAIYTPQNRQNELMRKIMYYGWGGPADCMTSRYGAAVGYRYTVLAASVANGHSDNYYGYGQWAINNIFSKKPAAPEGFTVYKISTRRSGYQDLVAYDYQPNGKLTLHKTSADITVTNGDPYYTLAGAVYGVYSDAACTKQVTTLKTSINGTASVSLKAGTYYVKEKSAPPGYQVDPSVITAKINTNATTNVTSSETPYRRGQIKLKKVDAVFGVTLSDAEFTLYRWSNSAGDYVLDSKVVDQKKDVTPIGEWVQKSGKWWYRYPDGSYPTNEWIWDENYKKYYHFDGNGWKDKESTTRPETAADTDGVYDSGYIHTSADNPDGKFKIVETKIPDNYSGSFTKEFTITDNVQLFEETVENTPLPYVFYLDKYDADDEEDKLVGAEFTVYEWSEASKSYKDTPLTVCEYDKGNSLGEYRATVEATLDNVGKFKIVETKYPDNYGDQLTGKKWEKEVVVDSSTPHTLTYDVANEWSRISGQIRLVKTDYETGSTLEGGAVFNVYEWDAKANAYREDPVDTLVYDADAKVYLSTILQRRDRAKDKRQNDGKYKIVEDYPIDGYANGVFDEDADKVNDPWSKEIEITDSMSFDTLNYFDLTVANKENEYHIKKISGNGKAVANLDGAVFHLKRTNDKKTITINVNGEDQKLTSAGLDVTVKNGEVFLKHLTPGTYEYKEVSAPAGFLLDKETYSFKVDEQGRIEDKYSVSKKVTNYPVRNLNIVKKDKDTGTLTVDGSSFPTGTVFGIYEYNNEKKCYEENPLVTAIYRSEDAAFVDETTMKKPVLKWTAKNDGKFRLIELSSSQGYILDKTPIEFSLPANSSGDDLNQEATNQANTIKLKKKDVKGNLIKDGSATIYFWNPLNISDQRTVSTGNTGEITVQRLSAGTWYYREVAAPTGYLLDENIYSFTVDKNGLIDGEKVKELELVNKKAPELKIKKVTPDGKEYDMDTDFPAGTEFDIYEWNETLGDYEKVPYSHVISALDADTEQSYLLSSYNADGMGNEPTAVDESTNDKEEKPEKVEDELEGIDTSKYDDLDFSSKRLIIESSNKKDLKYGEIESSYGKIYTIVFDSEEETKKGYAYYKEKEDKVFLDEAVISADNKKKDALSDTSDDVPLEKLESIIEDDDEEYPNTIALIDTGVAKDTKNIKEYLSVLDSDGYDYNGHGTAMAEHILQENEKAKILSIKALDSKGSGTSVSIYAAIMLAIEKNVSIINLSLYAPATEKNSLVEEAIQKALDKGIIVVGAAGNDRKNVSGYIPGRTSGVVVVGACDSKGNLISSSNYGKSLSVKIEASSTSEAAAMMSGMLSYKKAKYNIDYVIKNNSHAFAVTEDDYKKSDDDSSQEPDDDFKGAATITDWIVTMNNEYIGQTRLTGEKAMNPSSAPGYITPNGNYFCIFYNYTDWQGNGGKDTNRGLATAVWPDTPTENSNKRIWYLPVYGDWIRNGRKFNVVFCISKSNLKAYAGSSGWSNNTATQAHVWVSTQDARMNNTTVLSSFQYNVSMNGFKPLFTITYNSNGGEAKASKTQWANWDMSPSGYLDGTTRKGYTFLGWYSAQTGGKKITTDTKYTTDVTLYAHWQANSYPQIVKARYQNTDGSYGSYSEVYNAEHDYDSEFNWSAKDDMEGFDSDVYDDATVSYTVSDTEEKITYVDIPRKTVNLKITPYEKAGDQISASADVASFAVKINGEVKVQGVSTEQTIPVLVGSTYQIAYDLKTYSSYCGLSDNDTTFNSVSKSLSGTAAYSDDAETYTYRMVYERSYPITYELRGGEGVAENPTTYTVADSFTLKNPTRASAEFIGWRQEGSDVITPNMTIQKGTTGPLKFIAAWKNNISFIDEATGMAPRLIETDNNKGKFVLVETKSAPGYILSSERHEISIDKDMQTGSSIIELTYENTPNELILKKVDVNGNALPGAAFDIWYDGEDEKITKTVDENGELKLERLKPGLWHYQETEAPEDCILDNQIYDFTVGEDGNIVGDSTKTVLNAKGNGAYYINKVSDKGEALKGVTFEVSGPFADGSDAKSFQSNASGIVAITGLGAGTYTVKETDALPGYVLNAEPFTFEVNDDMSITGGSTKKFVNDENGVTIKKTDINGNLIEGAEFTITCMEDTAGKNPSPVVIKTNASGIAESYRFTDGTYKIVETKAPKGYVLDAKETVFEVQNGKISCTETGASGVTNLSITRTDKKRALTLTKKSSDGSVMKGVQFRIWNADSSTQPFDETLTTNDKGILSLSDGMLLPEGNYKYQEVATLDGYVLDKQVRSFTVLADQENVSLEATNEKTKIQIKKVDENGNPLAGVTFTLTDHTRGTSEDYTTNASGVITITGKKSGGYTLAEKKGLAGYKPSTKTWSFTIGENGQFVSSDLEAEIANGVIQYGVANKAYLKKSVQLTKFDGTGTNQLSGATFEVLEWNGTSYVSMNPAVTMKEDTTGVYKVEDLTETAINQGKFKVVETAAPNGYVVNYSKEIDLNHVSGDTLYLEAKNHENSITIRKQDQDGKPLAGVKFKLWKENESYDLVTDSRGYAKQSKLGAGTWYYQETEALDGYKLDATVHQVIVSEDGTVEGVTDYTTEPVINYVKETPEGNVQIKKTDESGNILSDVKFEVLEYNKTTGKYQSRTTLAYNSVTKLYENKAKLSYTESNEGKFKVVETESSSGYVADFEKEFTLDPDGGSNQLFEFTAVNASNKLKVKKVDDNKNPLSGVEFTLTPIHTLVVADPIAKTTVNGYATFENLSEGTYILKETKALNGYAVSNTKYSIKVNSFGQIYIDGQEENAKGVYTFEVENKKNKFILEKVDAFDEPLNDVEFTFWRTGLPGADDENTEYERWTETTKTIDGTDGLIKLTGLVDGTYYYQETKTLDGLMLDDTVHMFIVKDGNLYESLGDEETEGPGKNGEARLTVRLRNLSRQDNKAGSVVVEKLDSKTKEVLSDAEFSVYEFNVETGEYEGVTKYRDAVVPLDSFATKEEAEAALSVTLTDEEWNAKQYTVKNGDMYEEPYATLEYRNGKYRMPNDKDLIATYQNSGRFKVVETKTPAGHVGNWEAEINVYDKSQWEFTGDNAVLNEPSSFTVKKVGEDGEPLAGAVFEIWDSSIIPPSDTPSTDDMYAGIDLPTYTTDENGKIVYKNVKAGTTLYVREKVAPKGHLLDTTLHSYVVDSEGRIDGEAEYEAEISNTKNEFTLKKIAADTKKPMNGVKFEYWHTGLKGTDTEQVESDHQTVVTSNVGGEDGVIQLSGLEDGIYYFHETKTLKGYAIDDEIKSFAIKDGYFYEDANVTGTGTKTYSITVTNEVAAILPGTGGRGNVMLLYIAFAMFALSGMFAVIARRKSK